MITQESKVQEEGGSRKTTTIKNGFNRSTILNVEKMKAEKSVCFWKGGRVSSILHCVGACDDDE